jgi:hypothetical protein
MPFNGKPLVWSFSRAEAFASCPRAWYLATFGSAPHQDDEPGSEQPLSSWTLSGVAVHRAIATQLSAWSGGRPMDFEEAASKASSWIDYVWENRDRLIIECANGANVEPGLHARAVSSARRSLRVFQKSVWPRFDGHRHLMHEKLRTFGVGPEEVAVRIDLCTRSPEGRVVITDWKTSYLPAVGSSGDQLNVYALWATQEYDLRADEVVVQLVTLRTGEIFSRPADAGQLKGLGRRIEEQCATWRNLAFRSAEARPSMSKCIACRFLSVCDDGKIEVRQST